MSKQIKLLENGVTLICEKLKKSKLASLYIGVKCGACDETNPDHYGISHVLEHMCFKGTEKFTSEELNKTIEQSGAQTNAFTSMENTVYMVDCKASDFKKMSEILFDMVFHSTFPEEELEKEKDVIRQEILMYEDDPVNQVNELHFNSNILNGTIFNHRVIGWEETVNNITSKDLKEYRDSNYTPNRVVISAAGDFDIDYLEKVVTSIYNPQKGKVGFSRKKVYAGLGGTLDKEGDLSTSYVLWSFSDLTKKNKEKFKMSLFNSIFVDGMSSRLFKRIREDLGLVYNISSDVQNYQDRGVGGIFTICDYENVSKIEEEMFKIIEDMKKGNITDEEVEKAKNAHEVALLMKQLSKTDCAYENISGYLTTGKLPNINKQYKDIQSITKQDIIDFINKEINVENISRTIYHPKDVS